MSAKSVKDFQSFMINDAQLKSTGKCVNQVNLFALSNDKSNHGAKPNRIALVVVSYLSIFHLKPKLGINFTKNLSFHKGWRTLFRSTLWRLFS